MITRKVFEYAFDTSVGIGNGSGSLEVSLTEIDLSRAERIEMEVKLTKADVDAGDLLTIYLRGRFQAGVWDDRIASHQFTGDMSPTTANPETRRYSVAQETALTAAEEAAEPSGSTGASRLTAATVRNGPFPGKFRVKGAGGSTSNAWQLYFDQTNAGTVNADFEGTVYIYAVGGN